MLMIFFFQAFEGHIMSLRQKSSQSGFTAGNTKIFPIHLNDLCIYVCARDNDGNTLQALQI